MASCEKAGGVMGPVGSSDHLPSRVRFNHDTEAKRVRSNNRVAIQPDVVGIVEKAAFYGDVATTERAVNRSRWDMD